MAALARLNYGPATEDGERLADGVEGDERTPGHHQQVGIHTLAHAARDVLDAARLRGDRGRAAQGVRVAHLGAAREHRQRIGQLVMEQIRDCAGVARRDQPHAGAVTCA